MVDDVNSSRARRLQELARDPAHGHQVTPRTLHEAEVGLTLEEQGRLPAPIRRDPTGAAEFIDAGGTAWDVKGFHSHHPPRQGGFELQRAAAQVGRELLLHENVIVDTTDMTPEHVDALRAEGQARGWGDRVIYFP